MIRWLFVVLLVWPTVAAAQSISVQSGEHADFSRLVILSRDLPEWQFGRVEGGYEVRTGATDWRYDLARVFDLIPKTRITAVRDNGNGRLSLSVDCACHADAFEIRSGLVIDIKDGPAPSTASFEDPLPNLLPVMTVADAPAFLSDPTDIFALPSLRVRSPTAWQDSLAPVLPATPPDETVTQDRVAEAQTALLGQLSRAAGQGLITPMVKVVPATAVAEEEGIAASEADPDISVEMDQPDTSLDMANVRVTSSMEAYQTLQSDPEPLTSEGARCLPEHHFTIADWGVPTDNGAALSQYRARIVGEFDSADPASVEALVKYYIYLTFGAEAQALLSAFDTEISDAPLLHALAEIMDDGSARDQRPLLEQLECETNGAVWAVLARASLGRGDKIPVNAVISAFAAMPLHLRRHLGPGLAERFLAYGDAGTASAIRNAIARAPGNHGEAFALLDAELALEASAGESGAETLPKLVATGGDIAPRALVRLLDVTVDRGEDFAPSLIDTAEALAFEHRGTAMGAELARVHVRSLAHAGRFETAVETLAAIAEQSALENGAIEALNREIFSLAAKNATPAGFLTLVLRRPFGDGEGAEADAARRQVAERLLGLGFAGEAREILAEDPEVPTPRDRLLFAQSFLLDGQPDLAVGYLIGLDAPEAKALLARAHEGAGAYQSAARLYASIENPGAEARAIWRGEDWDTARLRGPETRRAAADLATQVATTNAELPTLARTQALLDQSETTRDVLRVLLSEPDLR